MKKVIAHKAKYHSLKINTTGKQVTSGSIMLTEVQPTILVRYIMVKKRGGYHKEQMT